MAPSRRSGSSTAATAQDDSLEPFPGDATAKSSSNSLSVARPSTRRRKSSGLPGDPRSSTGASSISTFANDNPDIAAQGSSDKKSTRRKRDRSLFSRWKAVSLRHTWLNPLIVVLIICGLYLLNPTPENPFHGCLFLSYPLARDHPLAAENYKRPYWSETTQYGKGRLDMAFVAFYTVFLSFTREFIMQRLLRPWAIWLGIKARGKQSRFMEQAYTAIYFGVFGPYGMYVMYRSPVWYFNTTAMFEDFPHRSHEGLFKAYYLLQASYWAQQAIVLMLQLEKPRKDFKELVGHHIITLALIGFSYRFHFTYMGIAVYITHDISDWFIAVSKMLNYVDNIITPYFFALFVGVWAYLRHYINLRILYATATEFRTVGPWELNWETQQYKCWISQPITFALLAALQLINLVWFVLILRILKNYIFYDIQEDERSEYDDGERNHVPASETTAAKRQRMGIPAPDDPAAVPANLVAAADEAASPAASTRSKAPTVTVNGHARSPSGTGSPSDENASPAPTGKGGSTRRRKKA